MIISGVSNKMVAAKKFAMVLMIVPLLAACSKAPSNSMVKKLVEEQYEQMNSAMSSVGGEVGEMMSGMMPKLESVSDINCDSADNKNTYRCTAKITQSIAGNSQTTNSTFLVYKVNDEWALGN